MSQEQAAYLCDQARNGIDAAVGQAWAFAFPSAFATLEVVANYLSAAAGEINGGPIGSELQGLASEVAGKANEIAGIGFIPWPFTYAAIGPWANAMNGIKSRIPVIVPLQGVRMLAPAARLASEPAASRFVATPAMPSFAPMSSASPAPMPTLEGMPTGFTVQFNANKGPKGYRRSDDRIREDVCDALSRDVLLDASDVEVKVQGGLVTLDGSVDSRAAKRRAEDCAYAVTGVRDVQNLLRSGSEGQTAPVA